ncbi:outer membrane protein assembly factor BamB family protein [Amycolatopsis mongoliensis]|uniref:outer membrane protein assembly factor BamB family protein n=1 Tax=Amycolatopsis mongoliensis TaxID=715475 RepID=UPI002FCD02AC
MLLTVASTAGSVSAAGQSTSEGDWATWQKDLFGSRYAAAEHRIDARNVKNLKLKWAFAYPKTESTFVRSEPAVVGNTVYFGGSDGKFYARNAGNGAAKWEFDLKSVDPENHCADRPPNSATTCIMVWDAPTVAEGKVYFGDARGYFYALDARTGALSWSARIDTHPYATVTSSPIFYKGRVYIGVSSLENGAGRDYACCTFRGHLDSLDARTGELKWRYYTVPEPKRIGTWPSGAPMFGPSGVGVWSSPVIDPRTGTLYVGTGQNYSGSGGDVDTMLALDARTGGVRWKNQVTDSDTWRMLCWDPDPTGYCPGLAEGTANDYDIGGTPNVFVAGDRTLVGVGQKTGVYHVFDARTGEVVWRRLLGEPQANGGQGGIQWGASYDGKSLYIATYYANPGKLFAVNPANGDVRWQTPNPADGCTTGGAAQYPAICVRAHGPAASSSPGLVWEGSNDGKFRAYDAKNGQVLWTFDTIRNFTGVNGIEGMGSAITGTGGGAVISNGMVYVQSGYWPEYSTDKGHVLLAFGL